MMNIEDLSKKIKNILKEAEGEITENKQYFFDEVFEQCQSELNSEDYYDHPLQEIAFLKEHPYTTVSI